MLVELVALNLEAEVVYVAVGLVDDSDWHFCGFCFCVTIDVLKEALSLFL